MPHPTTKCHRNWFCRFKILLLIDRQTNSGDHLLGGGSKPKIWGKEIGCEGVWSSENGLNMDHTLTQLHDSKPFTTRGEENRHTVRPADLQPGADVYSVTATRRVLPQHQASFTFTGGAEVCVGHHQQYAYSSK